MARWVRFVWWPLMVLLTVTGAGWIVQGAWSATHGGGVLGLVTATIGGVWLVGILREWPRWREVTYPEGRRSPRRVA